MNGVVHFEIPFDDQKRAQEFYEKHFGWKITAWPMANGTTYWGAGTTPVNEETRKPIEPGAINGGLMDRPPASQGDGCILVLTVDDMDSKIKELVEAGSRVAFAKMPIGDMGFYARVTDSEGNVIGLWQDVKK